MILGAVLIGGGGLHFLAAVTDVPGNAVLRDIHDGRAVHATAINAGLQSRTASLRYLDAPRRRLDIGTLLLRKAGAQENITWARNRTLSAARHQIVMSLTTGPANPYA
jgi:hypothetical protein